MFDMEGVVTDTASVHTAAWKALFDQVLPKIGGSAQPPFDPVADYRAYVARRTHEDAIRVFLAAHGITLPEGDPNDAPD